MTKLSPEQAAARADLCRFLSACYYEPAIEFSEERLFDSLTAAASQLSPVLAEHARRLGQAFAKEELQTLLVDYTRLFLGPFQPLAVPYGSHWQSPPDESVEDPMAGLLQCYEDGGFEIEEGFNDLPDHVAVELEFLYLLCFTQGSADAMGEGGEAQASAALRQRFLAEHLGSWVNPLTEAMRSNAQTAFYRELAEITLRWVWWLKGTEPGH